MSGLASYHQGLNAEGSVERWYCARGHRVVARRWRQKSGEIDLVLADADGLVFVEVKSSSTVDRALHSLGPKQMQRILTSGEVFADTQPKGSLTAMRFDVAAVDALGRVEVVENALAA